MDFLKAVDVNILDMWNTNVRIERKFLVDKRGPFRLPTKNSYRTVLLRVTR